MRLIKKAKLNPYQILDKLKKGIKISLQDKENTIHFQVIHDAINALEEKKKHVEKNKRKNINQIQEEMRQYIKNQYFDIIKNLKVFHTNKPDKVMTIFAGPNGSGKSTISQLVSEDIGKVINVDEIMHEQNLNFEEAKKKSIEMANECVQNGISFSIEATLGTNHVFKQIDLAKSYGFFVVLYYVGLMDLDLNLERVKLRVDHGGHNIPKKDIVKRYNSSKKRMEKIIDVVNYAIVIDNSGKKPKVIYKYKDGQEVYSVSGIHPQWIEEHLKGKG